MTRLEYLLASAALRVLGAVFSLLPLRPDRVTLATARVPDPLYKLCECHLIQAFTIAAHLA